jgi:gas vesicle protein
LRAFPDTKEVPMALLDDALKGWGGMLLGVVVGAMAAPSVAPAAGRTVRPLAKALIRGALVVGDGVREMVAEAREQVSDLVAEVQAEAKGNGAGASR